MNNDDIKLTDLFDVEMLQQLQDAFSKMTGMAAVITDEEGHAVTKGVNFTEFCGKYTRKSPIGCLRCEQCDRHGADLALKVGSSVTYFCHAGLMDFAAPIMAGDKLIGCFVAGQVLTSPPDITKVMQVAAEINVDLINYLQSIMNVPIVDKAKLDDAAFFLYTLTDAISSIAYHKYVMKEANIEIEKAANLKSDFLANMSHEIRTPMNAVIGLAEMALREDMSPAAKNYINQIKSSGNTLLTIINDILDFSKVESGKMDIVPVEYEPMSVMRDVANIISTRVAKGNVELVLDINPNIPKKLKGDTTRIKQIITNLSNNAAKFTHKGQILLTLDYRKLSDDTIDFVFSVKDTGIGIKREDLSKLFQSFIQVDSKRNRNIEGTGLGLAISKQLIELMNGEIGVESTYGEGSIFHFHLPQKIIDPAPSVKIKATAINTFNGLIDSYTHEQLNRDLKKLNIDYSDINKLGYTPLSIDLLLHSAKLNGEAFIFIDYKNFNEKEQQFIKDNPNVTAVIVADFDQTAHIDMSNVVFVHKPLSVLTIASIYKHENPDTDNDANPTACFDFTAEEAEILIVDDNVVNLTVACGLIEPLNMKIDKAISGKEAIEKISNKKYDLIFMDHMMPEMDGVETTHIIRRMYPNYNKVPIIALSANAVGDVKNMFIQEGMNDFVAKPIEVRTLIKAIKRWLPPEKMKKSEIKIAPKKADNNLPQIKNIDTKAALDLLGSEELFWTVLKDYYKAIPKKLGLIQNYKNEENWHNYVVEVHGLKSASRQIGALELAQLAADLETAGNTNDIEMIMNKTDQLLTMYGEYLEILSPFFVEEKKEVSSDHTLSKDELIKIFDEMSTAIEDLDLDQVENLIQNLNNYYFNEDETSFLDALKNGVDEMDPDSCDEAIKNWKNYIG